MAGDSAPRGRRRAAAASRLRPILMTSCAMIAGMVPMALGLGEGGEQTAPLGRAVIGGLVAATSRPCSSCRPSSPSSMAGAGRESASLDPFDPESHHFVREARDEHLALAVGAAGDQPRSRPDEVGGGAGRAGGEPRA